MSQQPAGLLCPACRVNLVMSERSGVEIDYCPRCRGVWLDRGELDKIVERAALTDLPPRRDDHDDDDDDCRRHYPPPPHDPRQYNSDYRHYPKKKSFWSELFD